MNSVAINDYEAVASAIDNPRYRLAPEQFRFFWEHGYLGPLLCDDPSVADLAAIACRAGLINRVDGGPIPALTTWLNGETKHINVHDPHLTVPEIREICSHPSIVNPIAQILGCRKIEFFQSRFRVKFPRKADPVPWHQDVGDNNGGCYEDGSPIPTITVWLSVDGATNASGSVKVVPGTHRKLFGDWRSGFHSRLEERGAMSDLDTAKSISLEAEPNQFYLFHSWTLHTSTGNTSGSARTGLVMRFVAPEDALHPEFGYIDLMAG